MRKLIFYILIINLFTTTVGAGPLKRNGSINKRFKVWRTSKVQKTKELPANIKRHIQSIYPKKSYKDKTVASTTSGKTTLKNVNITTKAKTGNINAQGKLNVAHINIAKGSSLKDTNINSDVKTKNISVSKGASAEIGSVNITK
jgi:hypothetical protein